MTAPRPDWRTIRGGATAPIKSALAASDSTCHCGADVVDGEPIYLQGVTFVPGDERPRRVDLSDAEWICGACLRETRGVPA